MNVALILSGGIGTRFGADVPKQYIDVGGKPIIAYSLAFFEREEQIDKIQVVAAEEWQLLKRR